MDLFPPIGDFITKIKLEDFNDTLKSFKNKTPDETEISKTALAHCPDNIMQSIINIFNSSLSIGYFPDRFKKANIIMIKSVKPQRG